MKHLLLYLILTVAVLRLTAATPFREPTELEKRLADAKAECCLNYDQAEAHFKFAGVLYDAGCIEAAFANVENLLRSAPAPKAKELFDKHVRRKLKNYTFPRQPEPHKLSPEQYEQYCREQWQRIALTDPAAAAHLRFSRFAERWRSKDPSDIAFVRQQIAEGIKDPVLQNSLQFIVASSSYLYLAAKDYENALPLFIRLYFHDPETVSALQAPLGFTINSTIQRLSSSRRNRLWIASRRDAVKFIVENMHTHPREVATFLRMQKSVMAKEKFVKLCLLAVDSVDLQLRTFAFGELMKRDLTPLLPLLKPLLNDPDAGRRATAALLLPLVFSPTELPEALAQLSRDPAAIVRMTTEAVAKKHCSAGNYERFRELVKKD